MKIEDFNNTEVKDFSILKPGEYFVNIQSIEVGASKAGNSMITVVSALEIGGTNFNHFNIEHDNEKVVKIAYSNIIRLLRTFGLKEKFVSNDEMLKTLKTIEGKNATLIVRWSLKKTAEKGSTAEEDYHINISYRASVEGAFAPATVVKGETKAKKTETIEGLEAIVKSNKKDIKLENITFNSDGTVTKTDTK